MTAILIALGLGFTAGLRTFTPLAAVRFPYHNWTSIVSIVLALGELIADKLPNTPARTTPGPLIVRIIIGGYCAWAISSRLGTPGALAMLLGAAGAIAGAYGGYFWRMKTAPAIKLPPMAAALIEDAVAVVGAFWMVLANQ